MLTRARPLAPCCEKRGKALVLLLTHLANPVGQYTKCLGHLLKFIASDQCLTRPIYIGALLGIVYTHLGKRGGWRLWCRAVEIARQAQRHLDPRHAVGLFRCRLVTADVRDTG